MRRPAAPSLLIALIGLVSAILLGAPGRTVTTAFVNDVLIFLDGAYRIHWGQVPNRDFHTALGPVVYLIPAFGYRITGSLGAAMPVGMALLILGFTGPAIHVTASRLGPRLAVPVAAFLILLLAVPMNPGDRISALSFAMFYNRIGWAALTLLLIMYLPPLAPQRGQETRDVLCAAALTLLQLYTKVTYGAVAVAFLVFLILVPGQRRRAALALLLVVVVAAWVEVFWRGTAGYVADLMDTARISGGRGTGEAAEAALRNLADLAAFALVAGIALWRRPSVPDLVFYLACAAAGVLIISQNAQNWGIITLCAGLVVAAQRVVARGGAMATGMPLLVLVFTLPPTLYHASSLVLHGALATANAGVPLGLPNLAGVRYARLWSPGDDPFPQRYVDSFASGGAALESLGPGIGPVATLDFVNPFPAGLGLRPPEGDNAWLHWNRNVSREHHLPPARLFADARIIMEPKAGINSVQLRGIYGPYIDRHYMPVIETADWTVHMRREAEE